ncbi:RidA family protein [Christensenellaceae bacterium OttesenSCG-928-M15]|nr:RidA family protein [Christensenellaceae bacterium OttesenSCG-928-M15]
MKNIISSPNAPQALGPYNHATEWNGFIFTSGQIGIDPATGKMKESLEDQTLQVFKNIESVLSAAGSSLDKILKCTVFLTDMNDFAVVNKIYGDAFQKDFPARSCVEVSKLPGGAIVEIETIAVK